MVLLFNSESDDVGRNNAAFDPIGRESLVDAPPCPVICVEVEITLMVLFFPLICEARDSMG